jgi:hypothetical protein
VVLVTLWQGPHKQGCISKTISKNFLEILLEIDVCFGARIFRGSNKKDPKNSEPVPEYLEEPEDKLFYNKYGVACGDNCLVDIAGNPIPNTELNLEDSCGEYDRYFTFGTTTEEQDEAISKCGTADGITLDIYDTKTRIYIAKGIPECRLYL